MRFLLKISIITILLAPTFILAQINYVPLAPIPDYVDPGSVNLTGYLQSMYKFGVALAGILAVLMLVWGGFKYTTSEAIAGKEGGKEIIQNVVWGGAIVLGSFLLLYTINPKLIDVGLAIQDLKPVKKAPSFGDLAKTYDKILSDRFIAIGQTSKETRKEYEKLLAQAEELEKNGDKEGAKQLRTNAENKRQQQASINEVERGMLSMLDAAKSKPPTTPQEEDAAIAKIRNIADDEVKEILKAQNKTNIAQSPEAQAVQAYLDSQIPFIKKSFGDAKKIDSERKKVEEGKRDLQLGGGT